MAYIYQITNDMNGKIYIGKSEFSIEKRFQEHLKEAMKERSKDRPLYRAIRKYGPSHFSIALLEETTNPEEREIFWIQEKASFKFGYNATIGGDGRKYIDYDEVVRLYSLIKNQAEVAKLLGIDRTSVRDILAERGEPTYSSAEVQKMTKGQITGMFDKNDKFILKFASYNEAANYLIEQKLTGCKQTTATTHISEVCRGKRKTFAGFKWKLL